LFVDFNLVQLITANIFLIKIEKIQWHTHTLHRYFTLETQTGKTRNMFRATPLLFIIHNHNTMPSYKKRVSFLGENPNITSTIRSVTL
jgi:hypothetical protein